MQHSSKLFTPWVFVIDVWLVGSGFQLELCEDQVGRTISKTGPVVWNVKQVLYVLEQLCSLKSFYHIYFQTGLFFARKIIFKVVKQVFYIGSTSHNKLDRGLEGQGIQRICHLDQIGSVNDHEWYHQNGTTILYRDFIFRRAFFLLHLFCVWQYLAFQLDLEKKEKYE